VLKIDRIVWSYCLQCRTPYERDWRAHGARRQFRPRCPAGTTRRIPAHCVWTRVRHPSVRCHRLGRAQSALWTQPLRSDTVRDSGSCTWAVRLYCHGGSRFCGRARSHRRKRCAPNNSRCFPPHTALTPRLCFTYRLSLRSYSDRRASMGSIEAARRAGRNAAAMAESRNRPVTIRITGGSTA
jgi:hypothetical protein